MPIIKIIDATLREGNQAPHVNFTLSDSVRIANVLHALDVDMIEVGHPYISESEMTRIRAVAALGLSCPLLAHARAQEADIAAVSMVRVQWVGIFVGINDISQKFRLNKSKEGVFLLIKRSITFAKSLELKVRFTIEDASRTPPS